MLAGIIGSLVGIAVGGFLAMTAAEKRFREYEDAIAALRQDMVRVLQCLKNPPRQYSN